MKKQTRTLWLFICLILTCCSFAFGTVSVFAMIKDSSVASDVLTDENLLNEAEWALDGATATDTFDVVSYGKRTALYEQYHHHGHIIPFKEINFDDGDYVEFTIDVYAAFETWFYLSDVESEDHWCKRNVGLYFEKQGDEIDPQNSESTINVYYADQSLSTQASNLAEFPYGPVRYNVKYFADSNVIYYSWTPLDRSGKVNGDKVEVYMKSKTTIDASKTYYAGIQISAETETIPATFSNLSIKNGTTELVPNYTPENLDWCVQELSESADKVFVGHVIASKKFTAKVFEDKEMVVKNAKNTDKMYAYEKLVYDENVDEQFKVSGKLQFRNDYDMNKAFGVALGLDSPSQDVNSSDTTLIGFENRLVAEDNAPLSQIKIAENERGRGYIIPLKAVNVSQKLEASFDIKSPFYRFIPYISTTANYFTSSDHYDAGIFGYNNGALTYTRSNAGWPYKDNEVTINGNNFTFASGTPSLAGDGRTLISDVSNGLNVKVAFYSNDFYIPVIPEQTGIKNYSVIEYTLTPYNAQGELDVGRALHLYSYGGGKVITSKQSVRFGLQVSGSYKADPNDPEKLIFDKPVVVDNMVVTNYTANGDQVLLNKSWDNITSNIEDKNQNKVFVGFYGGFTGTILPSVSTHVVVYEGGVEKAAKSLGFNAVGLDYIDFTFVGDKDGSIIATVNGNEYTLNMNKDNISGYIALASKDNFNAMSVAVKDIEIRRYSYKATENGEIATNFNTGYADEKEWMINSTKSVKTKPEDQDKVKGLVMEDGKLKFAGTTDKCYFSTLKDYGDVILEFKIEEFFDGINPDKSDSDKPKMVDDWAKAHSYSACYVNFGVLTGNGVGTSCMLGIVQRRSSPTNPFVGYINLSDYKSGVTVEKAIANNYNFYPTQSGSSKVTAVKIIASRNVITMYVQEVVDGQEPSADKYIEAVKFEGITDLYGRIAFTSTEAGWFNIDDVRIYPIDDPVEKRVEAKIDLFEDFKEIPDTLMPYQLNAPVVTLTENTISWEKVEGATGYRIKTNGFTRDLKASQLSYEFNVNGDYKVVVIALGNGAEILDSQASNELEFTVNLNHKKESIIFVGAIAGVAIVSAAIPIVVMLIKKRRKIKGSDSVEEK